MRRSIFDDMREIKVDAFKIRVLRDNHFESSTNASPDINQGDQTLKTIIGLKNLLHGDGGMVRHSIVENLVESKVSPMVLKRAHAISFIEWNPTIKNCILQIVPATKLFGMSLTKQTNNLSFSLTNPSAFFLKDQLSLYH